MPSLTLLPSIEVLLVDDQRAILAGVTALLESDGPSMRIVGHAMTGRQALELARSVQPDVIVLDLDLGGEDGLILIPRLRTCCNAAIIILSDASSADIRVQAMNLGAHACISKAAPGEALLRAVRDAAPSICRTEAHLA